MRVIALSVTKEMEVGIMIVHHPRFGVDMETVNQFILTSIENIKVGNTIVRLNGNKSGPLV